MIYFCTVHWKNSIWASRQIKHIDAYTLSDWKVACFYSELDRPIEDSSRYAFKKSTTIRDHATKLDILAYEVCRQSNSEDDTIVFIDSDAFPIAPWEEMCSHLLQSNKIVAVRRSENFGDPQPHPCFCVTTVKYWREIGGTWSKGHYWRQPNGSETTDVGANLLMRLSDSDTNWMPILRSNEENPHPLWFGIYGDIVYHHGAGSRGKISRIDQDIVDKILSENYHFRAKLFELLPDSRICRSLQRRLGWNALRARHLRARSLNSDRMSEDIESTMDSDLLSLASLRCILKNVS